MSWRWLLEGVVVAMHGEQIAEHGGSVGIRDAGLLSSALARPQNQAVYGDPSAFDLAAAYAFGIITWSALSCLARDGGGPCPAGAPAYQRHAQNRARIRSTEAIAAATSNARDPV